MCEYVYGMSILVCACAYVLVCACLCVRARVFIFVCMRVCMCACMWFRMYVRERGGASVCVYERGCVYVCGRGGKQERETVRESVCVI